MKSEFLPLSRSYNNLDSRYFPDSNFTLINAGERFGNFVAKDAYHIVQLDSIHEFLHYTTKNWGNTINQIAYNQTIITELFDKQIPKIDLVIKLEYACELLQNKNRILQEGWTAFFLNSMLEYWKKVVPDMWKEVKTSYNINISKRHYLDLQNEMKEMLFPYGEAYKKSILSKKRVQRFYNDLVWAREAFGNDVIPLLMTSFAFDLRHNLDPNRLIIKDPSVDVQWRFEVVVDALKSLETKGLLYLMPKIIQEKGVGISSHTISEYHLNFFVPFIHKLTGLDCGIALDVGEYNNFKRIMRIIPIPKATGVSERLKILKKFKSARLPSLIKFAMQGNPGVGFLTKEKLLLFINTYEFSFNILKYWINHFEFWIMKECILSNYDAESFWNNVSGPPEERKKLLIEKTKSMQGKFEFEKSPYYNDFIKIRKQNLKLN